MKQTAATASKAWYDQDCQLLGKANFPSASKHSAKGKNCYTWYFMGKMFFYFTFYDIERDKLCLNFT